jgi:hypothetical protein
MTIKIDAIKKEIITTELFEAARKYNYRIPIISFFWMYIISLKNFTRRQLKKIKK